MYNIIMLFSSFKLRSCFYQILIQTVKMSEQGFEDRNNNQIQKRPYSRIFKGILAAILVTGFIIYRTVFQHRQVVCFYDAYFELTHSANRQLVADPSAGSAYQGNNQQLSIAGKGFIGTGQVLMDLWVGILGLVWLIKIKNLRVMAAVAVFFVTRGAIFLNIEKLPFPADMAWRSPGFFALTVPYDHTRDFFYSGHTGTLTLIFYQMAVLRLKVIGTFAFLSLIFMMNMLIITRVHYTIDIIGGLVFACFLYRTSSRFFLYFDKLFSLPFVFGKWIYTKCCKQQQKENQKKQQNENGQNLEQEQVTTPKMPTGTQMKPKSTTTMQLAHMQKIRNEQNN